MTFPPAGFFDPVAIGVIGIGVAAGSGDAVLSIVGIVESTGGVVRRVADRVVAVAEELVILQGGCVQVFRVGLARVCRCPYRRSISLRMFLVPLLATPTDSNASPAARPTTADHLLFIGLGTASFCNYWAKCISSVLLAISPAIRFNAFMMFKTLNPCSRKIPPA
jgi:hypothetical protein